jgi:elongation factor P
MIDSSDLKPGVNVEIDGEYFTVVWSQHHKPGKGAAVMRTKLKNIKTGSIIERTFKIGEKFKEVDFQKIRKQYMYSDAHNCYFMDLETYEQISVPKEKLGEAIKFLKEGVEVNGLYLENEFLGVELPESVELTVTATVPGVRGDSVSNVMKPATLETGVEILVPLFISEGDVVKVNTHTGEYIERVEFKK